MKKIGYVIIGIITSVVLTYLSVLSFLNPIIKETGRSPESLMVYAYLIIYPISLFFFLVKLFLKHLIICG